ncbi:hypothetical protein SeMB42_g03524 [Synchytrium endobioticum]|uniref:RING-type domain-containing protein n=1 Tax=Synchytrium endobioticum TaxID=286115 RepID=A0A507DI38_9FUNG|nr:hypothetical protein SeMB42_g03524 [Synchytrium endobioticum]TPX51243.1 hypothetical protein SeLEV6574_g00379 [Synchytrium endobioticum]
MNAPAPAAPPPSPGAHPLASTSLHNITAAGPTNNFPHNPDYDHVLPPGLRLADLTPDEIDAIRNQQAFLKQHAGHEQQHSQMALILIVLLIGSQFAIVVWKKRHPKSFDLASLVGFWLIPAALALQKENYRFLTAWFLFSCLNLYVVRNALQKPIRPATPKWTYAFYDWVYKICSSTGFMGYAIFMAAFFHLPHILWNASLDSEIKYFETGILLMFYGLYFGVLGRDTVDRLADRMAYAVGYYAGKGGGMPTRHLASNVCCICGDVTNDEGTKLKLHKLQCGHIMHEVCIRGWIIVGKKDVCPYDSERVDMSAFSSNPWETTQRLYLNLLDAFRFLLSWQPLVFLVIHYIFVVLGYD